MNRFLDKIYKRVKWKTASGTIARIYNESVRSIDICLPPLPEQHRITAVLETWDKSLEKITRKIELKKNIKKGLMQELLTGKTRLKGFSVEWETVKLGDVCEIKMGQSPPSTSYNKEKIGIPLIQGNADIINRKTVNRIWTSEPTKVSNEKDIILTVRAPVGLVGISQGKVCIGRGVCAIKPQKADSHFVLHFLISFELKWKSLEQGSTFSAVNSSDIKGLELDIPKNKKEQTAIAKILTTADNEITALENKKQILENQKKYLLNTLITGQIRTPKNLTMPNK